MNSIDVTGLTCDYGHGHGIFDLTFPSMQAKYSAFSAQTHPEKQRPSVISWALHAPLPAPARLRDEIVSPLHP